MNSFRQKSHNKSNKNWALTIHVQAPEGTFRLVRWLLQCPRIDAGQDSVVWCCPGLSPCSWLRLRPPALLFFISQVLVWRLPQLGWNLRLLLLLRSTNRNKLFTSRKKLWLRLLVRPALLLGLCGIKMCLLERGSDGSFQLAVLTGIDETLLWDADNTYITTAFKHLLKTKRTSVFQKGSLSGMHSRES